MAESARAQHEVDKVNFEAAKMQGESELGGSENVSQGAAGSRTAEARRADCGGKSKKCGSAGKNRLREGTQERIK